MPLNHLRDKIRLYCRDRPKNWQVLREAGLFVDVPPMDGVTNVAHYEAFVLGSAVYAGQWFKDAVTFLESNEQTLSAHPDGSFPVGRPR